jgi:hypothetical protein
MARYDPARYDSSLNVLTERMPALHQPVTIRHRIVAGGGFWSVLECFARLLARVVQQHGGLYEQQSVIC